MDLNVPIGISFLGEGIITILLPFFNLAWLPLRDTKIEPLFVKVLVICLEVGNFYSLNFKIKFVPLNRHKLYFR